LRKIEHYYLVPREAGASLRQIRRGQCYIQ